MTTLLRSSPQRRSRPIAIARRQQGVVIFIALVVLVAMMFAGLAMIRSSGTAILTAGNLAFKQNATSSADAGVEAARGWVTARGPATLAIDDALSGYYATWGDSAFSTNPATWSGWGDATKSKYVGKDVAGNDVRYVVHRMCASAGEVRASAPTATPPQECVTRPARVGSTAGTVQYGERGLVGNDATPYFRITVKIDGPKNTVSFVQAMFY